jgi:hypothetical protein
MELPLAGLGEPPQHLPREYYERIPVRKVYRSYPIYHPDKQPAGYLAWLRQQEPQLLLEGSMPRTEAEWVAAGEAVFHTSDAQSATSLADVQDRAWYQRLRVPVGNDGLLPMLRYVVRERGKIEVGSGKCGSCHTRVLEDGRVLMGAQGNFPNAPRNVEAMLRRNNEATARRELFRLSSVPWLTPDPGAWVLQLSLAEIGKAYLAVPPGVSQRTNTSVLFPPKIPDLIGIRDRRYLDATGLIQHRGIGDLMRYAALVDGAEEDAHYGNHRPYGEPLAPEKRLRFSNTQLYALAKYIYSLEAPRASNGGESALKGRAIFNKIGCPSCHPAPAYTNHALTPVEGFVVPPDHRRKYRVMDVVVGTDPRLAMMTRKGTGYYRVPTLRGLWYRGPFEHSGSVARLEDWFDPNRLRDDYEPTGFRGYNVVRRAVPGHRYGLDLSAADRAALITFLKTL